MILSVLEIVEIIEFTLICFKNAENEFMCCRNCRKILIFV
jgi:hypothetical protein